MISEMPMQRNDRGDTIPVQRRRPMIQRVSSGRQRVLENILALRIADTVREMVATGKTVAPDHVAAVIQYACADHAIVLTEEAEPLL